MLLHLSAMCWCLHAHLPCSVSFCVGKRLANNGGIHVKTLPNLFPYGTLTANAKEARVREKFGSGSVRDREYIANFCTNIKSNQALDTQQPNIDETGALWWHSIFKVNFMFRKIKTP